MVDASEPQRFVVSRIKRKAGIVTLMTSSNTEKVLQSLEVGQELTLTAIGEAITPVSSWEDIPDALVADILRFAWRREPTLKEVTLAQKHAGGEKQP